MFNLFRKAPETNQRKLDRVWAAWGVLKGRGWNGLFDLMVPSDWQLHQPFSATDSETLRDKILRIPGIVQADRHGAMRRGELQLMPMEKPEIIAAEQRRLSSQEGATNVIRGSRHERTVS